MRPRDSDGAVETVEENILLELQFDEIFKRYFTTCGAVALKPGMDNIYFNYSITLA